MNRLLHRKNFMLTFMYYIVVFSLVYLVGIMLTLDLSLIRQILIVFAVATSAKLIVQNRILIYLIFFIVVISRFIPDHIAPSHLYFERLLMVLTNVYEHLFLNKLIINENILPFWIITISVYSIYTSFIIFRLKRGLWAMMLIYMPLFIYYWYVNIRHTYFALTVFLFAYLVIYGQLKFEREKHTTDTGFNQDFSKLSSSWYKISLIYGTLIVIIALLLPKTSDHMRWLWMENKINSVLPENHYLRYINNEYNAFVNRFNFAATGFQQNSSVLGGPVTPSDNLIMYVYADNPAYLRGTVRHNYNGSIWETLDTNKTEHPLGNTFTDIPPDERDYYDIENISVEFVNYSSVTLFCPYRTIDVHAGNKSKINLSRDHIAEIPEGIYNGESYDVTFLRTPSYYEALNTGINNSYNDLENIEDYLQVPMNRITQRTIDLKNEIVSGIEGNYEKAVAFESYLRSNYSYTLDTSVVPNSHEFIDYFLFEEQAGYCTYYATAMAIFLRLEGIPSRYVEGYVAHDPLYEGVYEIKQSNAHAWVEAYIEPVGWITFEPTASYPSENRILNNIPNAEDEETIPDQPEGDTDNEDESNDTEPKEDLQEHRDSPSNDESSDNIENENLINEQPSPQSTALLITGILFLTITIPVSIKILKYRKNEHQINALPRNERIVVLYENLLKTIEDLGYPIDYGETYYEYSDRIVHKFAQMKELTDIFVKTKYGNIIPNDDEVQKFTDYRSTLEEQLKKYMGTAKYLLNKYIY